MTLLQLTVNDCPHSNIKYHYAWPHTQKENRGRRGRDRMVVGFTITCEISACHH